VKNQACAPTAGTGKVVSIIALFSVSAAIAIFGAAFSIISILNDISFTVFSSRVHGAVFGLVILFLGARYFLAVRKLKTEVYKPDARFSWSNFRRRGKNETVK